MYVNHANNENPATTMNHSQETQVDVYKFQVVNREYPDSPQLEKVATVMHHSQETQTTVYGL